MKLKYPKINLIKLSLALALILAGAFCLTGCFLQRQETTLTGIGINLNGHAYEYDEECYLGIFAYQGNKPDLNYEVYAYYKGYWDTEKKKVDEKDYTVAYRYTDLKGQNPAELEELPETCKMGIYYIVITHKGKEFTIRFDVDKQDGYYSLITDKTTWHYGEKQPTLNVRSSHKLSENDITYKYIKTVNTGRVDPTEEELRNKKYYPLDEEEKRFEPGYYFLFAEVAELPLYKESRTNYVKVTVEKGELVTDHPNPDYYNKHKAGAYVYKFKDTIGNVHVDSFVLYRANLKNLYNDDMVYENVPVKIIADGEKDIFNCIEYEDVVFKKLKLELGELSEFYNEQEWYCNLRAEKATMFVPLYVMVDDGFVITFLGHDNNGFYNSHEWDMITITRNKGEADETEIQYYDRLSVHLKIEQTPPKGTYTYTFSLKDKTDYVWSDGTTEDKVFTVTVN